MLNLPDLIYWLSDSEKIELLSNAEKITNRNLTRILEVLPELKKHCDRIDQGELWGIGLKYPPCDRHSSMPFS